MVDIHQSYEDFRLDALLQYDLADDDDDVVDSESVHSCVVDEATFDELYTSIPDVTSEDDNYTSGNVKDATADIRSPLMRGVSKRISKIPSRRMLGRQTNDTREASSKSIGSKNRGLIQSVAMLLRRKRGKTILFSLKEDSRTRRGVERNMSNKSERTVLSFDDVVSKDDDDVSCSICYIDEDDDVNNAENGEIVGNGSNNKINQSSSASISSEVFADDESFDDGDNGNNNNNLHDSVLLASNSEPLVDECYDIFLNNSTDTIHSIDIGDEGDCKPFTTNDPMLNRSLPIIESLGLQALFFDDYYDDVSSKGVITAGFHRSMVSATTLATTKSNRSRQPRRYSKCGF